MPCYSASNVRFVTAEAQTKQQKSHHFHESYVQRPRAKTAAYRPPLGGNGASAVARVNFVPFQRRCEQYVAYDQKQLRRNELQRKRNQATKHVVLRPNELKRLREQSKVPTLEERLKASADCHEEHVRQEQLGEETRLRFKQIDEARAAKTDGRTHVEEQRQEKQSVLNRAFLAKQEQEEEVKQINRMILDAKCKAVREAQIQEKQLLARALREDDDRIARMVNERARQALSALDQRERDEVEKRAKYAQEIRQQLNEREHKRLQEAQRVAAEAQDMRQAATLLREEEERQREFTAMRKRSFREELQRIREMSNVFKKMLCEQERLAELRIVAYMREKNEKEQQLKQMQQLNKQEFERRQQRIFKVSAQAQQSRQASDELRYLRERDRLDREYRQKEKQAAIEKREKERDLLLARTKQAQEMKERMALEIAHAESEFNKLMGRMQAEEEKQKRLDRERESQRLKYRCDLKQQMTDKQAERKRLAAQEQLRMHNWLEQEEQRKANIQQVISSKMEAMRQNCLPNKYLKEVEKQLKKLQQSSQRIT